MSSAFNLDILDSMQRERYRNYETKSKESI